MSPLQKPSQNALNELCTMKDQSILGVAHMHKLSLLCFVPGIINYIAGLLTQGYFALNKDLWRAYNVFYYARDKVAGLRICDVFWWRLFCGIL
jgi:hypothetical protein